jgi:uncharacterized membrane protein YfcA
VPTADLILGGGSVFVAALLGGITGFGYALVATPLLLLIGFPLPFVVTANLSLALVTRMPVAYRFREHLWPRRVALLVSGSIPGLWLGAHALTSIDEARIRVAAGLVVMVAALLMLRSLGSPAPRPIPGAPAAAGFAGGFLGATTSLNGVAPVLLLARDQASPRAFIADLALYFVASNAIGIALLASHDAVSGTALFPAGLAWLPGSVAGNWIGATIGPRLPESLFRRITLAIVFVAGVITALTS